MIQLISTADGSHTIYVTELDEHYHSVHGAVQESTYIFIRNGFDFCKADPLSILEIGFGTGLNFLCAWQLFEQRFGALRRARRSIGASASPRSNATRRSRPIPASPCT